MNDLDDWKKLKIARIAKIERVVAEFQIWSIGTFPYAKVKVKILEDVHGCYTGMPNMAAKGRRDGLPDWVVGSGKSVGEALEATVKNLLDSIAENGATTENDFEWSVPEDF